MSLALCTTYGSTIRTQKGLRAIHLYTIILLCGVLISIVVCNNYVHSSWYYSQVQTGV